MTRRRVIFIDSDYSKYTTTEFNGDKSEFMQFGLADSCDKDWPEIEALFKKSETLEQFELANEYAQKLYHSSIVSDEDREIVLVERVTADDYNINDENIIFVYAPDVDVAKNIEFRNMMSQYCRQEIAKGHCGEDMCEFCPVNQTYSRIFDPEIIEDEDDYDDNFDIEE